VVNDCGLTDEQLDEMADTLRGTMRSIESYLEQYELDADPDKVEQDLLGHDCEMCTECGYWYECGDVICEHGQYGCADCRECEECEREANSW